MKRILQNWKPAALAALTALSALCGPAAASSLQVAPTSVVLRPGQQAEALWLSNTSESEPVRAQVRLFRWVQSGGEETLEETRSLVVSPPMIELAGGARQLVRVIRTGPEPQGAEEAYRLIVDEVPAEDSAGRTGLQFLLRYSIPVFVLPEGTDVDYQVTASLGELDGEPALVVTNSGNGHAQLADLYYEGPDGKRTSLLRGLVGYVLPGQTMRWALPAPASLFIAGGSFKVRINGEADEQSLAQAQR
ncbi:MAG: molecular chaperone [Lysobacter spongiicola]|nr:molecular chaperone [Lysobacter spongiicola]